MSPFVPQYPKLTFTESLENAVSDFLQDLKTAENVVIIELSFSQFKKPPLQFEESLQIAEEFSSQSAIYFEENLSKRPYKVLIEITEEELLEKEKFLTDYHVLNFLSSETAVDKVSIASVFTAISNMLRLCRDYKVDEIHCFSLRLVRIEREEKTYFLITDY